MSSVYEPENFAARVKLAADYIARNKRTTRTFDTCFEMWDGDAVEVALHRRATANPSGALARNFARYLDLTGIEELAAEHAEEHDLAAFAARLRAKAKKESDRFFAEAEARRDAERRETNAHI